jgi:hypothetical protein
LYADGSSAVLAACDFFIDRSWIFRALPTARKRGRKSEEEWREGEGPGGGAKARGKRKDDPRIPCLTRVLREDGVQELVSWKREKGRQRRREEGLETRWDNKTYASFLLLARMETGDRPKHAEDVGREDSHDGSKSGLVTRGIDGLEEQRADWRRWEGWGGAREETK